MCLEKYAYSTQPRSEETIRCRMFSTGDPLTPLINGFLCLDSSKCLTRPPACESLSGNTPCVYFYVILYLIQKMNSENLHFCLEAVSISSWRITMPLEEGFFRKMEEFRRWMPFSEPSLMELQLRPRPVIQHDILNEQVACGVYRNFCRSPELIIGQYGNFTNSENERMLSPSVGNSVSGVGQRGNFPKSENREMASPLPNPGSDATLSPDVFYPHQPTNNWNPFANGWGTTGPLSPG